MSDTKKVKGVQNPAPSPKPKPTQPSGRNENLSYGEGKESGRVPRKGTKPKR